ncbi:MAG: polysaccharide biosynthesis tyrosine autokinase, partial [Alteraurantiacibacter sp. bin_em_oilr2.035]|nr:polysaccharide biosynthesis tyrosine autokinase [Alteraurantiacibacter sp. bin_em_oilr2.035]
QTPLYRSTSQIEISRVDAGVSNSGTSADVAGEERDFQYYNTQYELLRSRAIAARLVEALNLQQDQQFLEAYDLTASEPAGSTLTNILRASVTVEPIEYSNLVNITFESPHPGLSARLANAWANQFLEMNFETRFGDTLLARRQLEEQLEEMRTELEVSESRLNAYATSNEIIVLEDTTEAGETTRSTILAGQLGTVGQALESATIRRIAAESALRAGSASEDTRQATMEARLAEARAQLASVRLTFGPDHTNARALEAEIASLRGSLQNADQSATGSVASAVRQARLEEGELRSRYETLKGRYLAQQGTGVEYGILEREVDTNRQIYDALLQRYNQLGVVGTSGNNMSLVEEALPAAGPYRPSLLRNLLIALACAFALGIALVYLSDALDQSIRDPEDVSKQFGLPLIGLIPYTDAEHVADELSNRSSIISEAYSSARFALQFDNHDRPIKSLMFTSTRPAEGKTSSSLAIAKSFADIGERVVLIDFDLRRRGLSKLLNMGRDGRDLGSFLSGEEAIPHIQRLDDYGVDFIGLCRKELDPVTLLAKPRVSALMRSLADRYDRIIVDGPPILGLADAVQLSRSVDGVVFAIQANAGTNRSVRRALGRLLDADAQVLGAIVTKLDQRNAAYGYGYKYGYGYSYGSEET